MFLISLLNISAMARLQLVIYEIFMRSNYELITIEGLRAKRAYVGFWPIFIFLRDRANFSQTDLF